MHVTRNSTPKYVASRTLRKLEWENSALINGHVPAAVASLKRQAGGDIAVLGSGKRADVDRSRPGRRVRPDRAYPIVLGSGKRLFRDAEQAKRLQLVDSKRTTTGSLILTYRPA